VLILPADSLLDQTFSLEDEEGNQYHWNVSRARKLATANPLLDFHLDFGLTPAQLHQQYCGLDEAYAMETDLKEPLLFVPFQGEAQLVDGFHRVMKALKTGVRVLPCYVLTPEQSQACLLLMLPKGRGIDWGQPKR
jgi:hypothetical protein